MYGFDEYRDDGNIINTKDIFKDGLDYEIMNYYLKPYHTHFRLKQGELIQNPFLKKKQQTPSFNIYKHKSGKWKYNDFATGDFGDVFDLVGRLFNVTFKEAKFKIMEESDEIKNYAIQASQNENGNQFTTNKLLSKNIKKNNMKNIDLVKNFSIKPRGFNDYEDRSFWSKYQITKDTLIKYEVTPIISFKRNLKLIEPPGIAYAYNIGEGYKIYQPLNPSYKFQFIGKKAEKFIFGFIQLPPEGELLIITGGEKDVLTLASKGYSAITLNSETASFPVALYENLRQRFRRIIILYDNDETGLTRSKILSEQFNIERVILPKMKIGKDVSDYVSLGYSLDTLFRLQLPLIFKDRFVVSSFNDLAINANSLHPIRKIWGCYVLENSLTVFPSERGSGKTFLMIQLAMKVAGGDNSFCNESIEQHGNVLYLNIEMPESIMSERIHKLSESYSPNSKYAAHCITFNGNIIQNLDKIKDKIKELKPVLIIIDNLRAASSHIDNEKNKAIVGFMQSLQKIIAEYNCAIILVHHTKKGTRNQYLNSDMQSGAGALTDLADADFLMGRSSQHTSYRLLKRLKSRNCGEQEKPKLLRLDPDTLWYECIEEEVNENEHISIDSSSSAEKEKETSEWKKLRSEGKTLDEIAKMYNVNKSTVSRRLKE